MKKFLIISCIAIQFTTCVFASTNSAAWTNAIAAFGGLPITQGSESYSNAYTTAQSINTPEGWALGAYASSSKQNLFLTPAHLGSTGYTVASAANAIANASSTPTPAPTPVSPSIPDAAPKPIAAPAYTAAPTPSPAPAPTPAPTPSTTPTATQTAASNLYQQIQSAVSVYNQAAAVAGSGIKAITVPVYA